MSASLQGPKLNYLAIEKQAYAIYKALNHFQPYLLKNHCIIFFPHLAVKSLCVQQDLGEGGANWTTNL